MLHTPTSRVGTFDHGTVFSIYQEGPTTKNWLSSFLKDKSNLCLRIAGLKWTGGKNEGHRFPGIQHGLLTALKPGLLVPLSSILRDRLWTPFWSIKSQLHHSILVS